MTFNLFSVRATSRPLGLVGAFLCSLALVASLALDDASAQPPMGPDGGFNGGGFPGGPGDGFPGGRGGRGARGRRDRGQDQAQEGEQDAKNGDKDAKGKDKPKLSLEEALKKADGKGVLLDQDNFRASDGAKMVANFYRKGEKNEDAPVVVILHGVKEQKEDFAPLAETLAESGCVVLVPDLRGTGGSAKARRFPMNNNPPNDSARNSSRFTNDDVADMIELDSELWFNFLFYLHDEGYCNVKKTIVIGSGFGAALAAAWTKDDWNTKGDYGQNVVGAVLISPDASNGEDGEKYDALSSLLEVRKKAKDPIFGCMVVVGKMDEDKFNDAKKFQQKIGGKMDAEAKPEDKKCPIDALETEKQGADLLKYDAFAVPQTVAQYVAQRLQKLPKKRQAREELGDKAKSSKSSKEKSAKNAKGAKKNNAED